MTQKEKETEAFIRKCVTDWVSPEVLPGACLYYAIVTNLITGAPIVAGSYSWQITKFDNGVNPTHFSCIFDRTAQQRALRLLNDPNADTSILPEMHVWNVMNGKVLDLSLAHIEDFASRMGFRFDSDCVPSRVHYGKAKHGKNRWVYEQDALATRLARVAATQLIAIHGVRIERR